MHKTLLMLLAASFAAIPALPAAPKPLRALLIAGGCCHDYGKQKDILKEGLESRAHVTVDIVYSPDTSTKARFEPYEKTDWAKGYDVIIHDECSSDVKDTNYVANILNAHRAGLPAVNLHCAMHSYRTGTSNWFEFVGIQSSSHGPSKPIEIIVTAEDHPITKGIKGWTTGNEELYNNVKVFPTVTPLIRGKQDTGRRVDEAVVAWINDYHGTRVFSTTLGHGNPLVSDARYLDLVARGLLWACNKLNDEYLKSNARADRLPAPAEVEKMKPVASPEKAAAILKEVSFPPEFDVTVFATPPAVNYPVFVAAAPDGTLYVSSDGNGSIDRQADRGRILRVRDKDGDGQADEVKVFVPSVDSPRGLLWDHDRLYLLHPPDISVFFDRDGDGVAEEKKTLVKNIAFTFKDRPADHTSNGIELGVDGWIYAAIGDFGFMQAEGADGRKVQLRNGGVVRVRPDGTGLEVFARGTRNILEVAVSPLLDGFARDNTNDGGGWDIRFHHFTGLEDHGYPRLFKNFPEEVVAPLAEYGGGSGCGAAWIDEPGIPAKWNNAPLTADWGRERVYHHRVEPNGATFKDTQSEFCKVTRTTDLDVDAFAHIYVASWKGATFTWAGNEVGYIVRASPKGYRPNPLVDLEKASERELIAEIGSSSHRRRLAAQRALIRKKLTDTAIGELQKMARGSVPLASQVAALFALKQALGEDSHAFLAELAQGSEAAPWAIRALTDRKDQLGGVPLAPILAALRSADARTRKEAVVAIARLGRGENASALSPLLDDSDPVIRHTAIEAMVLLGGIQPCLALLDSPGSSEDLRAGAFRVLQRIHSAEVVDALIARLKKEPNSILREQFITALARLYFTEGVWKGTSWGTRPDTRGPYYQPEEWAETPKIGAVLNDLLKGADAQQAAAMTRIFVRHRIPPGVALDRLLALASSDLSLRPLIAEQLAEMESLPDAAIPMLRELAADAQATDATRVHAIRVLLRAKDAGTLTLALEALGALNLKEERTQRALETILNSGFAEKHRSLLIELAEKSNSKAALLADAALLKLSSRNQNAKETLLLRARLDEAWANPARKPQLIRAMVLSRDTSRALHIVKALNDPNPSVVTVAEEAVRALKIDKDKVLAEAGAKRIHDMNMEEVLRTVARQRADSVQGEALFNQLSCNACHTTRADEPLKGPFLGNIANTYKRRELAEAILVPNRTLAQGFIANRFALKDGEEVEGFVIEEAADSVRIRTVAATEMKIPTQNITSRSKLEKSLMPEGLVDNLTPLEFASLIDYLELLPAKAQAKAK